MDFWQYLLALLFTQVGLAAAIIYIGKGLFTQVLARDVENHKHQLSRELEQFRRNLDALQFERQIKFSLMHEKRAEVIATLYGKLAGAHAKVAHMTRLAKSVPADEDERRKEAHSERSAAAEAVNGLQEYFVTHRIFLSEGLAKKSEQLIDLLKSSFMDFDFSQGISRVAISIIGSGSKRGTASRKSCPRCSGSLVRNSAPRLAHSCSASARCCQGTKYGHFYLGILGLTSSYATAPPKGHCLSPQVCNSC